MPKVFRWRLQQLVGHLREAADRRTRRDRGGGIGDRAGPYRREDHPVTRLSVDAGLVDRAHHDTAHPVVIRALARVSLPIDQQRIAGRERGAVAEERSLAHRERDIPRRAQHRDVADERQLAHGPQGDRRGIHGDDVSIPGIELPQLTRQDRRRRPDVLLQVDALRLGRERALVVEHHLIDTGRDNAEQYQRDQQLDERESSTL
jgi:hypothetical protein